MIRCTKNTPSYSSVEPGTGTSPMLAEDFRFVRPHEPHLKSFVLGSPTVDPHGHLVRGLQLAYYHIPRGGQMNPRPYSSQFTTAEPTRMRRRTLRLRYAPEWISWVNLLISCSVSPPQERDRPGHWFNPHPNTQTLKIGSPPTDSDPCTPRWKPLPVQRPRPRPRIYPHLAPGVVTH